MNNEIETLYPVKKKKNTKLIVLGIIFVGLIIIAILLLKNYKFQNNNQSDKQNNEPITEENINNNKDTEEEKKIYKCSKGTKNIDFATVEELYEFEYEKYVVKNEHQTYIFKFINKDLYSKIGMSELFTQSTPSSEFKDEENLTKTYYLNSRIPSDNINNGQVDIDKYLEEIQVRGYTCNQ